MMIAKLLVAIIAVSLGALSQLECDDEILITSKRVALTTTRAKLFQFLSDMRNFKRVSKLNSVDIPISSPRRYNNDVSIAVFDLLFPHQDVSEVASDSEMSLVGYQYIVSSE